MSKHRASLTVDHLTYSLDPLPDEFDPFPRLWDFVKMGVKCEAGYDHAVQETYYNYYGSKGCVYKSHHVERQVDKLNKHFQVGTPNPVAISKPPDAL